MTPTVVIITIVCYFAVLVTLGRLAGRGANNSTFFTGGRHMSWPIVALATIGAAISGVTFVSVPGMVAAKGYSYLQMVLGFIVGYAIVGFVLVPVFYRMNVVSIYSYLRDRFGLMTYKSGAWLFFISKILGASVRFFVVCAALQIMVFTPLGVPFWINVAVTVGLIWLYTSSGGVRTLIVTDLLKSICLVLSVVLCIWFIASNMGLSAGELLNVIKEHESARIWHFDNVMEGTYFWKQFTAGVFMAIATNGLDQDMMQRHLACRDSVSSRKNMLTSAVMQFFVIGLFLLLGTLLYVYAVHAQVDLPEKSDELFGIIATHATMPMIVGVVFVIGLVSAAYSAAGSALTALTTTFTIDILDGERRYGAEESLARVRRRVHVAMSVAMGVVIVVFYHMSSDDAISAVYTLASYTYGPILGLFAYGLMSRRHVGDRMVPWVCVMSPVAAWVTQHLLFTAVGYSVSFELLILNAIITMVGLYLTSLAGDKRYVEKSA